MKERLEKFLSVENISPSKFADEIGIQRSSISHILSGRNNPSLDVIQKILSRFPYINAEWLIMGKGDMFKPEREPTLFDNLVETSNNEIKNVQNEIENDKNLKADINSINDYIPITNTKKIEQIIVLYSDKTANVYRVE
ncbi:MAG: helix-turn-helix domain-containing protein [Bacteroidales bacterium]|nr:helix-turn-helix domain-containing protein [Bacteroidales bacterium]